MMNEKKIQRIERTEAAREVWSAVDRAAAKAPTKVVNRIYELKKAAQNRPG